MSLQANGGMNTKAKSIHKNVYSSVEVRTTVCLKRWGRLVSDIGRNRSYFWSMEREKIISGRGNTISKSKET